MPATLARLETLSIPLPSFLTNVMPGFYVRDRRVPMPWRVETPGEVATVMAARRSVGLLPGLVVAQPVAEQHETDPVLHDRTVHEG